MSKNKLSTRKKRLAGLGMANTLKSEYCMVNHLKALKEMGVYLEI